MPASRRRDFAQVDERDPAAERERASSGEAPGLVHHRQEAPSCREGGGGPGQVLVGRAVAGEHPAVEVVFDPQTSGGLLFGVRADDAASVLDRLHIGGDPSAAVIGVVTPPHPDGALFVLSARTSTET